ncbi:MAG TPA: hypothetical protein VKD67_00055, partial [Acidimicrobiales bacterium]|nr:hypothetical protein [Acidimicrobiales bacterium]
MRRSASPSSASLPPAPTRSRRPSVLPRSGGGQARPGGWAVTLGAFAVVAYVPPLLTARGVVAADTKQYLYLDPG